MKKLAVLLIAAAIALPAAAATKTVRVGVDRIVATNGDVFGGCLIVPSSRLKTFPTTCPSAFFSLDCSDQNGQGGSWKADAQRKLDLIQLARLTGEQIQQRGLTCIGFSGNGNGYSVFDYIPVGKGIFKFREIFIQSI